MGREYLTVPSYHSKEWKALRVEHLSRHPHCRYCMEAGKVVEGKRVNHKIPHRGNYRLWRDPANLETCCAAHDSSTVQRRELTGAAPGCGLTGWPDDPNHFWNSGSAAPPKRTNQREVGQRKRRKGD